MTTYEFHYPVPGTVGLSVKSYDSEHYEIRYDVQTGLAWVINRGDKSLKRLWPPGNYTYMEVNDE